MLHTCHQHTFQEGLLSKWPFIEHPTSAKGGKVMAVQHSSMIPQVLIFELHNLHVYIHARVAEGNPTQ